MTRTGILKIRPSRRRAPLIQTVVPLHCHWFQETCIAPKTGLRLESQVTFQADQLENLQHQKASLEQSVALLEQRLLRLQDTEDRLLPGHDLSEFYEGGLEKGGFSKLNLRKVRRRPGEGGGADEH